MPALSFKRQFAEAILTGRKTHTLRNPRARPIKIGDRLQLYSGMRTKQCRKIGEAVCDRVWLADLDLRFESASIHIDGKLMGLLSFAISDGFENFREMQAFWLKEHKTLEWSGVLIGWRDFKPEQSQ